MRKIVFILLISILFAGCKKKDSYIIPNNASIVISVDFVGLADETDLVDSSVFGIACRFLKANPMEIGIDFMEPVMLFELSDGTKGATMAVDDRKTLTESLKGYARDNIATTPRESGGLTWSKVLGEAQLAYDDNTLLVLVSADKSDSQKKRMAKELFAIDYEHSFYATKDYDRMDDLGGKDVVVYANLSALPDNIIDLYKIVLPKGVKCSDIETVSSFDSEDGQLVMKSELFSDDEKAQMMIDEHEKAIKQIKWDHQNDIPKEAIVTVMAGVEGSKIYEIIKNNPNLSKQVTMLELASGIDIGNRIKNAHDDVMICMDQEEILNITLDGEEYKISNNWTKDVVEPLPVSKEEVGRYSLFAYVDLEKIDNHSFSSTIPIPSVYRCLNQLHAVSVRSEGKGDITVILHSNCKENFLKQLLQ